ncbi:MAG: hypothetical protein Q4B88_03445 [Moraxella sp.]|nr:hypothetical protein [Moraxella sp.]
MIMLSIFMTVLAVLAYTFLYCLYSAKHYGHRQPFMFCLGLVKSTPRKPLSTHPL